MAARVRIDWDGPEVRGQVRQAAAAGLLMAAEHVLAASRQVVPIDEAALERSGTASVDASALTAAVSYDTPYAVRQHEELTWRHAPGRQAKYLERPLTASRAQVAALIAARIRRSLR